MLLREGLLAGVLTAILIAPALTALGAFAAGRRWPAATARVGAVTAGLGFAGTAVLAVGVATGTAVSVTFGGGATVAVMSADRLSVVLLLLVFGVGAVVQCFAVRYLAGDVRAGWFTAAASLLIAASAGLVTAASLITLAVFWTAAGAALCLLLATYPELPAARDGVARTVKAFVIGDLALWAGVALVTARWGSVDMRALDADDFGGTTAGVAAVLIVIAALARSAQIPFVRWLPATLAAPTPVSALLHAGVVNAGGVLLVKLAPLTAGADAARLLTIAAGAATVIYGGLVMLVKPDVKGALAHSTMAQMGFMTLACGMGLAAAAVFHLVTHGFYKALLFLSSGSAVAEHRRRSARPPAPALSLRRYVLTAGAAVALSGLALWAALQPLPLAKAHSADELAFLLFAWATAAAATTGWLRYRPTPGGVLAAAAVLLPVTFGYLMLVTLISRFLGPALPEVPAPQAGVWVLVALALGLAGLVGLRCTRRRGGVARLQRALYARALSAGHVPTPRADASVSPLALTGAR